MKREQLNRVLELEKITKSLLKEINAIIMEDGRPYTDVTMEEVIKEVCDYGGITEAELTDILGSGRTTSVVIWRQITCYILYVHTKVRPEHIKRRMGYTSTGSGLILHHVNTVEGWVEKPLFAPKGIYITIKNIVYNLGYSLKNENYENKNNEHAKKSRA